MGSSRVTAPSAERAAQPNGRVARPLVGQRLPDGAPAPEHGALLALQAAAGNAAVARLLQAGRPRPPALVQRCGTTACDCAAEEGVLQRQVGGPVPEPAPEVEPPGSPPYPHRQPRDDLESVWKRGEHAISEERRRARAERPRATLARGGEARKGFVSVADADTRSWFEGEPITYRPHWFHVLDAIEHEVGRARTVPDLQRVIHAYLGEPEQAVFFDPRDLPDIDPGSKVRGEVFVAAMTRRQESLLREIMTELNAHERAALKQLIQEARTRQGPCYTRHVLPRRGGNDYHNRFADLVTGRNSDFLIAAPGASTITDGLDSRDPRLVWEVKTRHEFLAEWALPGNIFSEKVQDAILNIEAQRQRHMVVAARCGYKLAYAFDTPEVAAFFKKHWSNNPPVFYRQGP